MMSCRGALLFGVSFMLLLLIVSQPCEGRGLSPEPGQNTIRSSGVKSTEPVRTSPSKHKNRDKKTSAKGKKNKKDKKKKNKKKSKGNKVSKQKHENKKTQKPKDKTGKTGKTASSLARVQQDSCVQNVAYLLGVGINTASVLTRQTNRIKTAPLAAGKKGSKAEDFSATADIVLNSLGGNVSAPACASAKLTRSSPYLGNLSTLNNCNATIQSLCTNASYPASVDTCAALASRFSTSVAVLSKLNQSADQICSAVQAFNLSTVTDIQNCVALMATIDRNLATTKNNCTSAFAACRAAQRNSVDIVYTCLQPTLTTTTAKEGNITSPTSPPSSILGSSLSSTSPSTIPITTITTSMKSSTASSNTKSSTAPPIISTTTTFTASSTTIKTSPSTFLITTITTSMRSSTASSNTKSSTTPPIISTMTTFTASSTTVKTSPSTIQITTITTSMKSSTASSNTKSSTTPPIISTMTTFTATSTTIKTFSSTTTTVFTTTLTTAKATTATTTIVTTTTTNKATTTTTITTTKTITTTTSITTAATTTTTTTITTTTTTSITTTTTTTTTITITSTISTTTITTTATTIATTTATAITTIAPVEAALLLGGFGGAGAKVEVWNCGASLADLPQSRSQHGAALLSNGVVYVCGGIVNSEITDTCDLYDTRGFWTQGGDKTRMKVKRSNFATIILNQWLVAAGGRDPDGNDIDNWEYLVGGTWSMGTQFPLQTPRSEHCGVAISQDDFVLLGGRVGLPSASVEQYSVKSGFVKALPDIPGARFGHGCAVTEFFSKIFVAGGADAQGQSANNVYIFDLVETESWSILPAMRKPRLYPTLGIFDGLVTAFGGGGGEDSYEFFNGTDWTEKNLAVAGRKGHAMIRFTC